MVFESYITYAVKSVVRASWQPPSRLLSRRVQALRHREDTTHGDFRNFATVVRNADIFHEYLFRNDLETRMHTVFIQTGVTPTGYTW